ncbi:NADH:ubiquinone oxidoreductase subunit J [Betaproteobacteria bacterium GR16-43]|nr:NADH:ubiquinone oxidoreductase subunit J [Betaproteobacteria bacterium GR16-43]
MALNLPLVTFWVFAIILILAALRVVTARNPVHAALFLVLCFFTASALWLLAQAEFLAITLVLVYVGAVMVLFLFVVMMLDINFDKLREGFWKHLPLAGGIGALMAGEMVVVLYTKVNMNEMPASAVMPAGSNTKALGAVLYTDYLLPFELAAVILLVAIVAAIAITLRRRKETKYQDPREQLEANRANRLKIVKDVK